ncbi:cell wall glucanase (Scw11), putative [Paecilomyces variotii No. 5]|uniref:Probable beta-glucosidase btgE n=1 Tax=Byssochlamys spectabilis (strain No. 5 / NBRC 109023) TaxID=1356009 RepID=V5FWY3_BYSSN|nr:cell wall glucanase (Scw11), putative [Paecilomyces variotii No. 5]
MKGAFLTAAAALMGSALADGHMRRHGHEAFHHRRALGTGVSGLVDAQETCGCTTKVITYYGSPTLVPHPAPSSAAPSSVAAVSVSPSPSPSPSSSPAVSPVTTSKVTQTQSSTSYSTVTVEASSSPAPSPAPTSSPVELPTPSVTTFPSTGTFTIPETTITVQDTTTVCGASSTSVPSGTHTLGGVTTIVETSTVVTCPYATVKPTGSTVTSVIETTTYTCPAAGTYTVVPPFTTTVPSSTVVVFPTPATITPGTYPRPAQVVTVTETDYTYTCPFDTGLPSSTPAATPSSAPAVATSSPVSGVAAIATSSTPSVTPSSSAAASASATPSTSSGSNSNRYAMVYGIYTNDSGCKSQSTISQEVADIAKKGFSAVRVYSTDCNTLQYVGEAARQNNIKMIPGVYIESGGISSAYSQLKDLIAWGQWDLVDAIVLGNEAIQGGAIDASGLVSFVKAGKSQLVAAGYTGMVTLAETLNIWQQYSSTLCEVVDQPVVNSYAYFNGAISALGAGSFVKSELDELNGLCPGKSDGWVGESGWPSQGNSLGAAIANTVEQTIAILAIEKEIGNKVAFFEYANEAWKPAGSLGVENFWGCFNIFSWLL